MFYYDPTIIFVLIALVLAVLAQRQVTGKYKKYSHIRAEANISGAELARMMLADSNIDDIDVLPINGSLTDNYHPIKKTIYLSEGVYSSTSIAALAIAAHETGHAMQYAEGYLGVRIRGKLLPAASFGSNMAFPLFFIGLLFSIPFFMDIGIWFFGAALLFQIVTLPVEFDASKKGLAYLKSCVLKNEIEISGASQVLRAAALTYVASAIMALVQFLRLIFLRGNRN